MNANHLWPLTDATRIISLLASITGATIRRMKHPWDILSLLEKTLSRLKPSIHPTLIQKQPSTIEGNVVIGPNVRIFEGAKIVGPAYIGEGTIIGNGALVRDAVIADHCVVGYCTEIARSFIGSECWFHTNYVGDSVFEGNISMGSGAITANLRLDEEVIHSMIDDRPINSGVNKFGAIIGTGVRFGINAGTMPGVKVGKDSFIASGVMVPHDIPDGSFVLTKQALEVRKNRTHVSMERRKDFHKKL